MQGNPTLRSAGGEDAEERWLQWQAEAAGTNKLPGIFSVFLVLGRRPGAARAVRLLSASCPPGWTPGGRRIGSVHAGSDSLGREETCSSSTARYRSQFSSIGCVVPW